MDIFADFHHPALYYSLYLLLEKRLGHTLYRPIGREWCDSGNWKLIDLCVTEEQREEKLQELLIPDGAPLYSGISWNKVLSKENGYFLIDKCGNIPAYSRAVTLEQFKRKKFDLMIASFVGNIVPFEALASKYQDNIEVLVQVGNYWDLRQFKDKYVLASIKPTEEYEAKEIIFYRQEFDIPDASLYQESLISSFVAGECFSSEDISDLEILEESLSKKGFTFRFHSKTDRDGFVSDISKIMEIMKRSKFGLHFKPVKDAYGHVIHNWAAIGRPVIFKGSQYHHSLGGDFLEHMVTGIDVDIVGIEGCIEIIKAMTDGEHTVMCKNMRKRFKERVDFDKDANNIKDFFRRRFS